MNEFPPIWIFVVLCLASIALGFAMLMGWV